MKSPEIDPSRTESSQDQEMKQFGKNIIQLVQSIPYGGQHETYIREIIPVSEFRANLPA